MLPHANLTSLQTELSMFFNCSCSTHMIFTVAKYCIWKYFIPMAKAMKFDTSFKLEVVPEIPSKWIMHQLFIYVTFLIEDCCLRISEEHVVRKYESIKPPWKCLRRKILHELASAIGLNWEVTLKAGLMKTIKMALVTIACTWNQALKRAKTCLNESKNLKQL